MAKVKIVKKAVKRGGSLSFLVGTISNVLVMEIGWTDVGSGGYILVSCAHSNTSFKQRRITNESFSLFPNYWYLEIILTFSDFMKFYL
jgi:hypothetical protein